MSDETLILVDLKFVLHEDLLSNKIPLYSPYIVKPVSIAGYIL